MPTSHELATHFFLQLAVLLATCRLVGWGLRWVGQTQVVSEMISGVLLGPSFLGLLVPEFQSFLFPKTLPLVVDGATKMIPHPSMMLLLGLSQLGLVLYMFMIGLEFNTGILSKHWRSAGMISLAGVLVPTFLGGVLGWMLVAQQGLFTDIVAPWQAALFMGAAMLITAFPMLARIIYESGISNTKIGTLAVSAAAFDDAIAWVILAVVVATSKNSIMIAVLAVGGGIFYCVVMALIGKPLFKKLFANIRPSEQNSHVRPFVLLLLILMGCAWFTDKVGIYSIFGAFILGAMMPRCDFTRNARRLIEPLTVSILLPIFFVYSGLNTQLNVLVQPSLLGATITIILVAFLCKGGACFLGSRLSGMSWREAGLIGVLMNARGLMELLLVNIGRDNGLISPALFSMLVLMTICTTAAASPLFNLLSHRHFNKSSDLSQAKVQLEKLTIPYQSSPGRNRKHFE
jgi:Kef-type K+ transport system membrane component KefB